MSTNRCYSWVGWEVTIVWIRFGFALSKVDKAFACKMGGGCGQVSWVSWDNSSIGVCGQTTNRCYSWVISVSISKTVVWFGFSFALSKKMTTISELSSEMLSGSSCDSRGVRWSYCSVGVSSKSTNRGNYWLRGKASISISKTIPWFSLSFTFAKVMYWVSIDTPWLFWNKMMQQKS